MNKVFLIGNLTRDPEVAETANGASICRFDIAVNRNYTSDDGERQTDFFHVTAWRGLAESVAKYCVKGSKIAVSGSVQIRNYEDNKGNKRTAVDIIAQEVEFLSPKQSDESGENTRREAHSERSARKPVQQRFASYEDDMGDIPF